eukprot:549487-Hanusia_phi.AAC.6
MIVVNVGFGAGAKNIQDAFKGTVRLCLASLRATLTGAQSSTNSLAALLPTVGAVAMGWWLMVRCLAVLSRSLVSP